MATNDEITHDNTKIAAIIPTKNEAPAIGKLIDCLKEHVDRIIVVDGSSSDGTAEIAKSHGAEVFEGGGIGKGHDLRLYQRHAQQHPPEFDIYVMLDGDMSCDPEYIPEIIKPIVRDEVDVVIGSRFNADQGFLKNIPRFGRLVPCMARFLYQRNDITDVTSGYWGFSENFFKTVPLSSEGFDLECELFNYANRGYRFKRVPITYRQRIGYSKLSFLDVCKLPLYFLKYYGVSLLKDSQSKTNS